MYTLAYSLGPSAFYSVALTFSMLHTFLREALKTRNRPGGEAKQIPYSIPIPFVHTIFIVSNITDHVV